MSLATEFKGDIKSGKTLSMVYWASTMMMALDVPVWTNMKKCYCHQEGPLKGVEWAETISLDDLKSDLRLPDHAARFKKGIVMLDEAHILMGTNVMRGINGDIVTDVVAQCGKRGLCLLFSTHLDTMMAPRVREFTQYSIWCRTRDQGHNILWDATDLRAAREANYQGNYYEPSKFVLKNAQALFDWYEADEPIDVASGVNSIGGSKVGQRIFRQLDKYSKGEQSTGQRQKAAREEFSGVSVSQRRQPLGDPLGDQP